MKEQVENPVSPEEIASQLGLGYFGSGLYVQRIYRRVSCLNTSYNKTIEGKRTPDRK